MMIKLDLLLLNTYLRKLDKPVFRMNIRDAYRDSYTFEGRAYNMKI